MSRTFSTEFINYVEEEIDRQQKEAGSMKKSYYHSFYFAQEAANRLDLYREKRRFNKKRALQHLVDAATSIIGEFNKHTNYLSERDFNKYFVGHLKDEVDRLDSIKFSSYDYVDDAIRFLVSYCDFGEREKRKASKYLLNSAALIMRQYNLETR
ncbi:MAG: hypothetical protein AABY07_00990 [Nanoarchaeota archaeon]